MTSTKAIRWVGWIEAASFLILLGIGMPLKYVWGQEMTVKIVGPVHGGLFVLFVAQVLAALSFNEMSRKNAMLCLIGAVLPFGPLLYHNKLDEPAEEVAG